MDIDNRLLSIQLEFAKYPKYQLKFLDSCDNQPLSQLSKLLSFDVFITNINEKFPDRTIYLIISLVNEAEQMIDYPVPNKLFNTDKKLRYQNEILDYDSGCFCLPFESQTMKCEATNFQIVKCSPREISQMAESFTKTCLKKENKTIDWETFLNQSKNLEEILLSQRSKCRLKLQARIYNNLEKKFESFLTEPIYSHAITDSYEIYNEKENSKSSAIQLINTDVTNVNNFRILRTSRMHGSIDGGDEMFLFTTFFDPNDLMVEFFQLNKNGDVGWKAYANFNKCDSHVNFALVVKTPKFDQYDHKLETNQKIKVYLRLFRPSRQDYSEKWSFYYVKNSKRVDELIKEKFSNLALNSNLNKRKIDEKCDPESNQNITTNELKQKNKILKSENKSGEKNDLSKKNEEKNKQEVTISIEQKENNLEHMEFGESNSSPNQSRTTYPESFFQNKLDVCYSKMNNLADRTGQSLLKFAKTRSLHDLLKTQRFLLNFADEKGNCPLHLSILYKNYDLLEIFVDVIMTIPHQNIINLRNKAGLTPLMIAVHLEELELCEFLLQASADLSMADFDGNNAIHLACKRKNVDLLKVLIKHVDKQYNYGVLNAINHEGYAPIHLCIINKSFEMVRELLYFKTLRINISDKRLGYTALHHACICPSTFKIVELLVKNEKIDLNCRSHSGCTPLHLSVANRNYLATIVLMRNGADPNIQNDYPVHIEFGFMQHLLIKDLKVVEDYLKKKSLANQDTCDSERKCAAEELTKLSVEVKKIFEPHLKSCIDLESNPKSKNFNHNHDPLTYADSDPWMKEIFKNPFNLRKELLLNIGCYEKIKKEIYDEKISLKDLDHSKIKAVSEDLKNLNEKKDHRIEKLSQQESSNFNLFNINRNKLIS